MQLKAGFFALFAGICLWGLWPAAQAGTLLVANKSEASVSLFQTPSLELVATLPTGEGPHEVAVSPDGRRALVSNYGVGGQPGDTLTVVDIVAARVLGSIALAAGARPHGLEWLDDTRAVVTAEGISSLLLVDVQQGRVTRQISIGQDVAHMVAVARDTARAFVANIGSGTATAIDLQRGVKIRDLVSGAGSEGIAVVDSGAELWVSNRKADTVAVFDAGNLQRLAEISVPGFPIRVEADDGRGLVYVTLPAADALAVFDVKTRRELRRLEFDLDPDRDRPSMFASMMPDSSMPIGVLLSGDGETLYVAHSSSHVISVLDASTLSPLGTLATGIEPDGMGWSPLDSGRTAKKMPISP